MGSKLILDLCSGSGAWSEPYRKAGYDVMLVDILTGQDVRLVRSSDFPPTPIHGILAAPPCTMFCRMRMCRGEPSVTQFLEGLSVVDACLRLVAIHRPTWWALENPQGYLKRWLGPPRLKFDPWQYGDPWTKRTWLWGNFAIPAYTLFTEPEQPLIHRKKGSRGRAQSDSENAITPPGFAQAFYEANP